jgi:CheY-like chemotaxis protein
MKPKRTILLVDDNEPELACSRVILKTAGYQVAGFTTNGAAVAYITTHGVDVVLAHYSGRAPAIGRADTGELAGMVKAISPRTIVICYSRGLKNIAECPAECDRFYPKGSYNALLLLETLRQATRYRRGPRPLLEMPLFAQSKLLAYQVEEQQQKIRAQAVRLKDELLARAGKGA